MSDWWEIALIGVGLSMDALAVSLALGTEAGSRSSWRKLLLPALFFGGFQALMPLAGWFFGELAGIHLIRNYGRFVAAALLWLIGGKMIHDRHRKEQISFDLKTLLILAVATSIDAFLVGVGFACLGRVSILPEAGLIGITTAAISAAGCLAGRYSRLLLGGGCAWFGGGVLIAIGVKFLVFG